MARDMAFQQLPSVPHGATELGRGQLTWFRDERISDRYGAVYLDSGDPDAPSADLAPEPPNGTPGRLVALVLETRHSEHIGDMFRGLRPSTPARGDVIVLGAGALFREDEEEDGHTCHKVGLEPRDGRKTDWLDPQALYRLHEQTVRLFFAPTS